MRPGFDSRHPGVFVLSGKNDHRIFDLGSSIDYDPQAGLVIVQTVIYSEDPESGKPKLTMKPVAWLKLEEGMVVGLGQGSTSTLRSEQPYLMRGKERFNFRPGKREFSLNRDVITLREELKTHVIEWPGWPEKQIAYLIRLGLGLIYVDSNSDRPMNVGPPADDR